MTQTTQSITSIFKTDELKPVFDLKDDVFKQIPSHARNILRTYQRVRVMSTKIQQSLQLHANEVNASVVTVTSTGGLAFLDRSDKTVKTLDPKLVYSHYFKMLETVVEEILALDRDSLDILSQCSVKINDLALVAYALWTSTSALGVKLSPVYIALSLAVCHDLKTTVYSIRYEQQNHSNSLRLPIIEREAKGNKYVLVRGMGVPSTLVLSRVPELLSVDNATVDDLADRLSEELGNVKSRKQKKVVNKEVVPSVNKPSTSSEDKPKTKKPKTRKVKVDSPQTILPAKDITSSIPQPLAVDEVDTKHNTTSSESNKKPEPQLETDILVGGGAMSL